MEAPKRKSGRPVEVNAEMSERVVIRLRVDLAEYVRLYALERNLGFGAACAHFIQRGIADAVAERKE